MKALKTFIAKYFTKPDKNIKRFFQRIISFFYKYRFQFVLLILIIGSLLCIYYYFASPPTFKFIKRTDAVSNTQKSFINTDTISYPGSFKDELRDKDSPFNIRNIAIALAAIATAVFTWWKNSLNNKTNEISQKKTEIEESTRQDSLFAQAVSFLNENNDLTTRKAGVHILKDLAMTSPKHAQKCIDMLCSLNESWMPKFLKDYPDFFLINNNFPNIKNIEELTLGINKFVYNTLETKGYIDNIALSQLVLLSMSEIIRYINNNNEYKGPFDLQYKYLCTVNLSNIIFNKNKFKLSIINLQNAFLYRADLQRANLYAANLQNALLAEVDLQNAFLMDANLQNVNLGKANLQNANLCRANLRNADFTDADLRNADFMDADLRNADLYKAKLQSACLLKAKLQNAGLVNASLLNVDLSKADLRNADLRKANLQNAYLEAADFTGAKLFLTDFRNAINIDKAIFDDNKKDAIFTDEDYKRHYPDNS